MRGNWEAAEALVLAPSQQLQQQQQQHQQQQQQQPQQQQSIIMEEQRLPLQSPTTPAWSGIADRIVKEEPIEHHEDKNNDSGVSPGHYTSNSGSPRSRRSSSAANCSLSPGSASSHDSNAMQCESFDYSPQSIYKNCGVSSLDYVMNEQQQQQQLQQQQQQRDNEHTAMDVVSNSMKPGSEQSEQLTQDALQCPICQFTTINRMQFTEHLAAHYAAKCETPDFSKSLLTGQDPEAQQQQQQQQQMHMQQMQLHMQMQLQMQQHPMNGMMSMDDANRASPSQGERSEQESEEADEPGLRVPRVNAQGKVKKFRCKQCNFVAITKLEFWEHSRGHIKAEKLLTCPKCPFVTEYKHHLEYHLRNHFGSKPFKCDKCSYSCVNKSMLNSHLKSHSNVYQYRCANCSYATKYCHSLKLHLRKYSHQPAMVLNADGSPNPLPIIDVYGTKRGPKQKPANPGCKQDDGSRPMIGQELASPGQQQQQQQLQLSPVSGQQHLLPINPMSAMHALTNNVNQGVMGFPYNRIFTGFPMANHYPIQQDDATTEKQLEHLKTNLFVEYAKAMAADRINEIGQVNGFNGSGFHETITSPSGGGIVSGGHPSEFADSPPVSPIAETPKTDGKITPLDLSKPDVVANNNNNASTVNNMPRIQGGSNANSPKTSGTSRRKGRAVKLDRRVVEEESDEEGEKDGSEDGSETRVASEDGANVIAETCKETSPDRNFGGVGMSNEFTCQYCEIAFGNVVMYTVHMGYHGYKDPYTCNMCGHECDDKVSFFLHIARVKHS